MNLDPLTSLADRLALIEAIAPDLAIGDDRLRLWGCKVVIDGGPASAARSEPYVNDRDGVVV